MEAINFNQLKLEKIKNNKFFLEEKNLLQNKEVAAYYKYIIDNIDINKANPTNSYIMWLCDKVDIIDTNKSTKIKYGHISLPDIDIDVPALKRDNIIQYIKNKYGIDHVAQIVTFGRLQGRSAIKEVFRVKEACSFTEVNEITKHIPDEARISDQLEEMDEDERSIIMWALLNNKNDLKDFCFINHNGDLEGDYAEHFRHAIAIEGTFKTQGKHAAGIVVSKRKLKDVCPMVNQKDGDEKICGFEMEDLESVGLAKLDLLGLSLLDKLMYIKEI